MVKGLFASEIAELLECSSRWIQKKATKERWANKIVKNPQTGQQQPRYVFDLLPLEIQEKWCIQNDVNIEDVRQEVLASRKQLPFDQYPQKHRQVAIFRQRLLDLIITEARKCEDVLLDYNSGRIGQDIFFQLGEVSRPTISRWQRDFKESGLVGLCPKYVAAQREVGERTLDEQMKSYIETYYLKVQKPSMKEALRQIERRHNVVIPYRTALRYIESLPASYVVRMREGEKKYNETFEPYLKRDYTQFKSMQLVVSDHKTFDLLVTNGERIFRPYLTAFIDMRSRKLLGWHIDETPCKLTIMTAMERMFRVYGACQEVLIDNGADFKAKTFQGDSKKVKVKNELGFTEEQQVEMAGILSDAGVKVHFTTPYRGQSKPIERYFSTLIETFEKGIDSYIGSNTVERPERVKLFYGRMGNKEKLEVTLTIDELREAFDSYANWFNENWAHTGQGMNGQTPAKVFEQNWEKKITIPDSHFRLLFSDRSILTVGRNGIQINGIFYYSVELYPWKTKKVIVRRPISDVGSVWVYDLDGRFICEAQNDKLVDLGITALNLKKLNKIRKQEMQILKDKMGNTLAAQAAIGDNVDFFIKKSYEKGLIKEPETEQIRMVANLNYVPDTKKRKNPDFGILENGKRVSVRKNIFGEEVCN